MAESPMNDHPVILINMPWSRVDRPSIQLGILESVLIRAGILVEARSFNLAFLDHIVAATGDLPVQDRLHFTDYLDVSEDVCRVGLGDWIFAVSPFSNSSERDEQYLRYLRGIVKHEE